jgi:hypothetical protein
MWDQKRGSKSVKLLDLGYHETFGVTQLCICTGETYFTYTQNCALHRMYMHATPRFPTHTGKGHKWTHTHTKYTHGHTHTKHTRGHTHTLTHTIYTHGHTHTHSH